jgi:hypothetical protein
MDGGDGRKATRDKQLLATFLDFFLIVGTGAEVRIGVCVWITGMTWSIVNGPVRISGQA